jgi:hypothetical protein
MLTIFSGIVIKYPVRRKTSKYLERDKMLNKAVYALVTAFAVFTLIIGSCGPQSRSQAPASKEAATSVAATSVPRGITGTIKTGTTVASMTVNMPPEGGKLAVNKSGDPLDGMALTIPAGAYSDSKQFKIAYAAIESQTFGADFNPVTPLITVDNGGDYANEIITTMLLKINSKACRFSPGTRHR